MRYAIKLGMCVWEFWECDEMELYQFIRARKEFLEEELEQGYDYVRLGMWASIAAMSGDKAPKLSQLLPLKRDQVKMKKLTPYEKQQQAKWAEIMDREMGIIK